MSCWTILEINPTKDLKEIKKAYSRLIECYNIEKDTNEYTILTNAYVKAMSLVNTSVKDMSKCLSNNSMDYTYENIKSYCDDSLDNKNYISDFNYRLNYIYTNPTLRFSIDSWVELLKSYMFINKDLLSILEKDLINYIFIHRYIPHEIFLLFDKYLKFNQRESELYEKYPKNMVDFLLQEINHPLNLSYNYLSTISKDKIEEYLELREKAFIYSSDKNVIEYLSKAYSIYAYDLDLLRLLGTYYLNKNDTISALTYFREALEINSSDMYCLASFGHLLVKTKQYAKAILYLEKYTSKLKNHLNINALTDLALSYYYSYEYFKALDLFQLLSKLTPQNTTLNKYINAIKEKIENVPNDKITPSPMYKRFITSKETILINKLNEIYTKFQLRIDIDNWKNLLSYQIFSLEELSFYIEQIIIEYLTTHKFIPNEVFILFSNHFKWLDRKKELFHMYTNLDINILFKNLYELNPLSYSHLKDIDDETLNHYLELRSLAFYSLDNNINETLNYLSEAYKIYSNDYELFMIYGDYYLSLDKYDKAEKYFTKSLSLNDLDYYSMYRLGIIFSQRQEYSKALIYLEKLSLIKKGIYFIHSEEFLMEIALCYYYTNNLILAKKYFKKLRLINNSLHFIDIYLKNINYRLNGVNKKAIPISVISNPNYNDEHIFLKLFKNSKRKISLLFT